MSDPVPAPPRAPTGPPRLLHAVRGSRGILAGTLWLLAASLLRPAIPPTLDRWWLGLPALLLLVAGMATLGRDAMAVRQRTAALEGQADAIRRVLRAAAWPLLLVILLSPHLFLAAYGVPHLSPLTGLVTRDILVEVSTFYLFAVLLVAIRVPRATKRYASIPIVWPGSLDAADPAHPERRVHNALTAIVAGTWVALLQPFWTPFSLLAWPPGFQSLAIGNRGLQAIAFATIVPVLLFSSLSGHVELVLQLRRKGLRGPEARDRRRLAAGSAIHVLLCVAAAGLHLYDLLWIVRDQAAFGL